MHVLISSSRLSVCVCAFLCRPLADAVVHEWTVVVKPCMLAVSSFTIKTFQTKQPNIPEQNGGANQDTTCRNARRKATRGDNAG